VGFLHGQINAAPDPLDDFVQCRSSKSHRHKIGEGSAIFNSTGYRVGTARDCKSC
jgi:hypothetical protein